MRFFRCTIHPRNKNRTSKMSHNQVCLTQIPLLGKNIWPFQFYKGGGIGWCWLSVVLEWFLCFDGFFVVTYYFRRIIDLRNESRTPQMIHNQLGPTKMPLVGEEVWHFDNYSIRFKLSGSSWIHYVCTLLVIITSHRCTVLFILLLTIKY